MNNCDICSLLIDSTQTHLRKDLRVILMRGNQLLFSADRWQHGSEICFAILSQNC
jgi:hypothetical protein